MPINNNLPKIIHKSHRLRDCHRRKHEFNCLEAFLDVELVKGSYPSWKQLKSYIPRFVNATWGDKKDFSDEDAEKALCNMFQGKHLPGAMETFQFTFFVKGMTYIGVSHWLRHREIVFSSVCSGDRQLSDDAVMVPESIMNSPELFNRYIKTCEEQFEIYCDLVESGEVSTMDARYVLPKSTEQQYFMTMNFRTLVKVINQRISRNIQPWEDNIIAYKMILCLIDAYPKLKELKIFDVDAEDKFYQKNAREENSTNLYLPEPQDDKFEYRLDDFVYQCHREDLKGTSKPKEKLWGTRILEYVRSKTKL